MNRNYYRIMPGKKAMYASECREGNFIGGDWDMDIDLSKHLPDNWREFNKKFIPEFLKRNPDRSKVAAGLACGMLHTICKGMQVGDVVLSPNGHGEYYVGVVSSDYQYTPGATLPHRRTIDWLPNTIEKQSMSQALQNSAGSIGTVSNISKHALEIEKLIAGNSLPTIIATDDTIEDPSVFALEKHLEDFLVANWKSTKLGKEYNIVEEDGEIVGKQFPCETGSIDILAQSKDEKTYLVIELKKGRASDVVVGQIQRYMGDVKHDICNPGQDVKGVIIALEDDIKLKRALSVTQNIDFYRYQISFKLTG